jgi:cytochrome c oxidase cbb3-type subunit 4
MLKFIKSHMSTIEGVDVTASIALVMFVAIFLYIVFYALFVMDKQVESELSSLPLQEDDLTTNL